MPRDLAQPHIFFEASCSAKRYMSSVLRCMNGGSTSWSIPLESCSIYWCAPHTSDSKLARVGERITRASPKTMGIPRLSVSQWRGSPVSRSITEYNTVPCTLTFEGASPANVRVEATPTPQTSKSLYCSAECHAKSRSASSLSERPLLMSHNFLPFLEGDHRSNRLSWPGICAIFLLLPKPVRWSAGLKSCRISGPGKSWDFSPK